METAKPSFTENTLNDEKIVLFENDTTITKLQKTKLHKPFGLISTILQMVLILNAVKFPKNTVIKTFEKYPSILNPFMTEVVIIQKPVH